MEHKPQQKDMRSSVLESIKSGQLKMIPKWHFALRTTLVISGGVILALAIIYLGSFIVFAMHQTGAWYTPRFGSRGIYEAFRSLPWVLVILALVFIVVLEVLAKHFAFTYRLPLLYSLLCIMAVVLATSILVSRTAFHRTMSRFVIQHRMPFAEPFYRGFGERHPPDVHRGIVINTTTQGFMLNEIGEPITILITRQTRLPFGTDFEPGDQVLVFGDNDDHTIQALGIRKISE